MYVTELSSQEVFQRDLFGMVTQEAYARQAQVMDLVDSINEQWGRETLSFGSQGTQRTWYMRQERRSKRFTTS